MNSHNEGSVGREAKDLGWLVRCKTGCEGIVNDSVPRIGDPCPFCACGQTDKACLTYCVKITAAGDAYEQLSLEGGISLEGDVVQPWDVDLGGFLAPTDSEDSTLAVGNGRSDSEGRSISVSAGGDSKETIIPEVAVAQEGAIWQSTNTLEEEAAELPEQQQKNIDGDDVTDSLELPDGVRFDRWHVLGLICCAALLLIGGLLTFDIVRSLYRPSDTIIASPILRVLR